MGNITIEKLTGDDSPLTYNVRNLQNLDIILETPALIYAIPESTDEDAIGMKVEGNTMLITISWTLVDDDTTLVDQKTGSNAILTADDQMEFLVNTFQSSSVEDDYRFKLFPNGSNNAFFTKKGILTKANINKSGNTPVTYTATVVFSVGNMSTAADNQEANQGSG